MQISTLLSMREKFYSSIESMENIDSVGNSHTSMMVYGPALVDNETSESWGLNIDFKSLKDLFVYLLGIHSLEPIFGVENALISLQSINANLFYTFEDFDNLTTIDGRKTFIFKPVKKAEATELSYRDKGYLGERNTYRPFGYSKIGQIDTKATLDIAEVKRFFEQHFRHIRLNGTASFSTLFYIHNGMTINISDKKINLIVISNNPKDGLNNYEALVIPGD